MASPVIPAPAQARLRLGQELARLRRKAGRTQETMAGLIDGYCRSSIADAERGRRNFTPEFWAACDDVLNAGGDLIGAYEQMTAGTAAAVPQPAADPALAGAGGRLSISAAGIEGHDRSTAKAGVYRCPNCQHPLQIITVVAN